jgi:hypothetical protein
MNNLEVMINLFFNPLKENLDVNFVALFVYGFIIILILFELDYKA